MKSKNSYLEIKRVENRLKLEKLINFTGKVYPEKKVKEHQTELPIMQSPLERTKERFFKPVIPYSYIEKISPEKQLKAEKNKKRSYFKEVRKITKLVDKAQIKGYDKRLVYNHRRDGLMVTAYDRLVIDHKIPLIYGYKNGISPEKLAHISNLQYLTVRDNMIKGVKPLVDDSNKWILE